MTDSVQVLLTTQETDLAVYSESGDESSLHCRIVTGIRLSGGRPGLKFFQPKRRETPLKTPLSLHTVGLTAFQAYRLEHFARSCFLHEPGELFDCLHLIDYLTGTTHKPITDRRWLYEYNPVSANQVEIGKPYVMVGTRGVIHAGLGLDHGLVLSIWQCVPIICSAESLLNARGGAQLGLITGNKASFKR